MVIRYHHHHHHSRFNVRVSALSTGWTVPQMPLLHLSRSCASTLLKPSLSMSPSTHSIQVFLFLPLLLLPSITISLHFFTQSSAFFQTMVSNKITDLLTIIIIIVTCPHH